MGEMADYDIEQGQDMWWDHLAGHPQFPDICPYCEDEMFVDDKEDLDYS